MVVISTGDAVRLPLHDALIIGLCLSSSGNGRLTASIKVRANPEEPLGALWKLGLKGPDINLVFGECWQVATNLLGFVSSREVISSLSVVEMSDLKQLLISRGIGQGPMIHFRVVGSHGSQLDFVASSISISGVEIEGKGVTQ